MSTFINRFRRKPGQDGTPQHANTLAPEVTNTSEKTEPNVDSAVADPEKPRHEVTADGASPTADEDDEADLPDDVRELPKIVRSIVSLEDDTTAPTLSFRYFLLCFIFIPPGAILFQMGNYRTTSAVYPVLFVQIGNYIRQ